METEQFDRLEGTVGRRQSPYAPQRGSGHAPDRSLRYGRGGDDARPRGEHSFMTAIITLREHPQGTEYVAHVMHKSDADRTMHEKMGFADGWGTVAAQLADLTEQRAQ